MSPMSLHCLTHPWSRMAMGRESQASCRGIPPFLLENGYGTTYSRITLDSGVSPPCLRHRIRVVVRVLLCVLWMGLCCPSGASVCICFFVQCVWCCGCVVLVLRAPLADSREVHGAQQGSGESGVRGAHVHVHVSCFPARRTRKLWQKRRNYKIAI